MKYLQLLVLVLLLSSCSVKKVEGLEGLNPAANEVHEMILYTENQLNRHDKGEPADFSKVNAIVNLSGIAPKVWDGNYLGLFYTPSNQDVMLWKHWFGENKNYFSYDPNNEPYKTLLNKDEKIIVLKLPSGAVVKSKRQAELERLDDIYQRIYNRP